MQRSHLDCRTHILIEIEANLQEVEGVEIELVFVATALLLTVHVKWLKIIALKAILISQFNTTRTKERFNIITLAPSGSLRREDTVLQISHPGPHLSNEGLFRLNL